MCIIQYNTPTRSNSVKFFRLIHSFIFRHLDSCCCQQQISLELRRFERVQMERRVVSGSLVSSIGFTYSAKRCKVQSRIFEKTGLGGGTNNNNFCQHSVHYPTNAPNKTQLMARIKLLHVSAPGCHPHSFSVLLKVFVG